MLEKLQPAVNNISTDKEEERSSKNLDFVNRVVAENVKLTIAKIKFDSSILNKMLQNDEIAIIGAIYDVQTGQVEFS